MIKFSFPSLQEKVGVEKKLPNLHFCFRARGGLKLNEKKKITQLQTRNGLNIRRF